jgi:hypothetical protein
LFGASTGAAAALVATARRPSSVIAIVSRGGRPDLAGKYLSSGRQPTLLIVGERDPVVLKVNRAAMETLAGEKRPEIIPGASHLFEEPGALEQVARRAVDRFARFMTSPASRSPDQDGEILTGLLIEEEALHLNEHGVIALDDEQVRAAFILADARFERHPPARSRRQATDL